MARAAVDAEDQFNDALDVSSDRECRESVDLTSHVYSLLLEMRRLLYRMAKWANKLRI